MGSEKKFRIKIYRHRNDERTLVAECSIDFPTHIDLRGYDAKGNVERQLSIRPKIDRCKPEIGKEVIEKIEAQLGDEVGSELRIGRGIKAIIDRYKRRAGGVLIDDYSWTIEALE
jgi:hypothetical protein